MPSPKFRPGEYVREDGFLIGLPAFTRCYRVVGTQSSGLWGSRILTRRYVLAPHFGSGDIRSYLDDSYWTPSTDMADLYLRLVDVKGRRTIKMRFINILRDYLCFVGL